MSPVQVVSRLPVRGPREPQEDLAGKVAAPVRYRVGCGPRKWSRAPRPSPLVLLGICAIRCCCSALVVVHTSSRFFDGCLFQPWLQGTPGLISSEQDLQWPAPTSSG